MKPQLIYRIAPRLRRRSSKRVIRIKPAAKLRFVFRPVRFGLKPQIKTYESP